MIENPIGAIKQEVAKAEEGFAFIEQMVFFLKMHPEKVGRLVYRLFDEGLLSVAQVAFIREQWHEHH